MKIQLRDVPLLLLPVCVVALAVLTLHVVFGPKDKDDTYIIQDSRGHYIQCHDVRYGASCDWDNPLSQEEYDKAQGE